MSIKFCSEAYFFRLESLPEDLYSGFLRPEKIHRPQPDLNLRTAWRARYPETTAADKSQGNFLSLGSETSLEVG